MSLVSNYEITTTLEVKTLRKLPKEMAHVELLEVYSKFNRLTFRSPEEQEYIAALRIEMLERMGYKFEEEKGSS